MTEQAGLVLASQHGSRTSLTSSYGNLPLPPLQSFGSPGAGAGSSAGGGRETRKVQRPLHQLPTTAATPRQHLLPGLRLRGNSFHFGPPSSPLFLASSPQNKLCDQGSWAWLLPRSFHEGARACVQPGDGAFPAAAAGAREPRGRPAGFRPLVSTVIRTHTKSGLFQPCLLEFPPAVSLRSSAKAMKSAGLVSH